MEELDKHITAKVSYFQPTCPQHGKPLQVQAYWDSVEGCFMLTAKCKSCKSLVHAYFEPQLTHEKVNIVAGEVATNLVEAFRLGTISTIH